MYLGCVCHCELFQRLLPFPFSLRVEGRTWYTPHRGRLWIASAKYMPDGEEIAAVEQQYRDLYNGVCVCAHVCMCVCVYACD